MKFLKASDLDEQHAEMVAKMVAIVDVAKLQNRELNEEEAKEIDQIEREIPEIEAKRERLSAVEARQSQILQNRITAGQIKPTGDGGDVVEPLDAVKVPARAKASRTLMAYDNERDAYVSGQVILAGLFKNQAAADFCDRHGLRNTMSESVGSKGGFLVREEMQRTLVRLREERGIFPRYARNYPMGSDNLFVPRDINDVTAYWTGEAAEITASDDDLGAAELTAKKLACLTKISSELDEDSVVDVAEMVTRSMAYAMADKIDEAGFNGDGTSTYGGVLGLKNALASAAIIDAATGNDAANNLDLADFEDAAGALPQYSSANPVWFVNSAVYYASMARLMNAAGGTTGMEIANGTERRFLGFPVVFAQVLPSTTGTSASTIVAYLGDLSLAATVGVRRGVRTQVSVDRYFENDLIGVKCTERIAINVHERGDTIRTRPIVAVKTAA